MQRLIPVRGREVEIDQDDKKKSSHHEAVLLDAPSSCDVKVNGKQEENGSIEIFSPDEQKHLISTAALMLCTFVQAYLLISLFPYAGYMAIDLLPEGVVNEENVGLYAGLLASSFMWGRVFSSYFWGVISDLYGRKAALNLSLTMSAIFSLLFGLSSNFYLALISRFFLGISNGIVGIVKTVVTELAYGNEKLEARCTGLVIGMRGWGFLLCPAIGGFLAEPCKQYSSSLFVGNLCNRKNVLGEQIDQEEEVQQSFLSLYPFFLPNLLGAFLCVVAILGVVLYIEETLPTDKRKSLFQIPYDIMCYCQCNNFVSRKLFGNKCDSSCTSWSCIKYPCMRPTRDNNTTKEESQLLLPHYDNGKNVKPRESLQKDNDNTDTMNPTPTSINDNDNASFVMRTNLGKPNAKKHYCTYFYHFRDAYYSYSETTRRHLISYWLFSFIVTAIDEAFPLFCISKEAGLGLSEVSIGKILSTAGLIFASCQYYAFARIVEKYGIYKALKLSTIFGIILTTPLIPLSSLLSSASSSITSADNNSSSVDMDDEENNGFLFSRFNFVLLSFLMGISKIFCCLFFAAITIATNKTVLPEQRGTMNGINMVGASLMKALGPTFSGILISFSLSGGIINPHIGSFSTFSIISLMGFGVLHQLKSMNQ